MGQIGDKQLAFMKDFRSMIQAIPDAHPAITAFKGLMEIAQQISPEFFEIIGNFFQMANDMFNAGLGDSFKRLGDILFNPTVVSLVSELAETMATYVNMGLKPAFIVLESMRPIVEAVNDFMQKFNDKLIVLIERLDPLWILVEKLADKFGDKLAVALDKVFDIVDKLWPLIEIAADGFEKLYDAIEPIIDLILAVI